MKYWVINGLRLPGGNYIHIVHSFRLNNSIMAKHFNSSFPWNEDLAEIFGTISAT